MGLNKTKILGISITTNSREEILEEVRKRLESVPKKSAKNFIIVTPNPEQLVLAQKDKHFAQILNQADIAIPDGIGLVWAMRRRHLGRNIQRIPGVELMEDLVAIASKEGYGIGLIGGWHGVAVKALECLQKKYPGLRGWAREPENVKDDRYPEADIVFVGLGAPKQEYFMERYKKPCVLMAVGGAFDIIAGRRARAPLILRTIGVEWLWRLIREPWRWRRQLALVKFLWLIGSKMLK